MFDSGLCFFLCSGCCCCICCSATSVDFLLLWVLQIFQLLLLFLRLLLFVFLLFLAAAFSDVVAAAAGRPWVAPEVVVSLSLAVLLAARPAFEKMAYLSSPVTSLPPSSHCRGPFQLLLSPLLVLLFLLSSLGGVEVNRYIVPF